MLCPFQEQKTYSRLRSLQVHLGGDSPMMRSTSCALWHQRQNLLSVFHSRTYSISTQLFHCGATLLHHNENGQRYIIPHFLTLLCMIHYLIPVLQYILTTSKRDSSNPYPLIMASSKPYKKRKNEILFGPKHVKPYPYFVARYHTGGKGLHLF